MASRTASIAMVLGRRWDGGEHSVRIHLRRTRPTWPKKGSGYGQCLYERRYRSDSRLGRHMNDCESITTLDRPITLGPNEGGSEPCFKWKYSTPLTNYQRCLFF